MAQTTIDRSTPVQAATTHEIALPAGTPVLTLQGILPVEHILPQDRVVTRSGAVPVLGVAMTVRRDIPLLQVSARALGHDRPEADILLPAAQTILLRDWRARAMFGADQATVALSRLIDGTHIRHEPAAEVRMIRLTLPRAAVLYAAGIEVVTEPARVTA
jgi:hypothetical protein